MENTLLDLPKAKDLKAIPKDTILEGVIIDLEIKTWLELTKNEEKKKNLKNPDGKVLCIKYEVVGLLRNETIPISDNPTTNSRYGRFILKYNIDDDKNFMPTVGMKIKVMFDSEGKSEIILKK